MACVRPGRAPPWVSRELPAARRPPGGRWRGPRTAPEPRCLPRREPEPRREPAGVGAGRKGPPVHHPVPVAAVGCGAARHRLPAGLSLLAGERENGVGPLRHLCGGLCVQAQRPNGGPGCGPAAAARRSAGLSGPGPLPCSPAPRGCLSAAVPVAGRGPRAGVPSSGRGCAARRGWPCVARPGSVSCRPRSLGCWWAVLVPAVARASRTATSPGSR